MKYVRNWNLLTGHICPNVCLYRVAHIKVAHTRAACSYCDRIQGERMRKLLLYNTFHSCLDLVCATGAVLITMPFSIPELFTIAEMKRANLKRGNQYYF